MRAIPSWASSGVLAGVLALSLGCGAGQEQAAAPGGAVSAGSVAANTSSTSPKPEESPFVPRTNDPICGGGYKWAGARCIEEERASPTERKAASLARKGADGLQIDDITVGSGREVRVGDIVKLHYTGTLADGTTFDSSRTAGPPFEFRVGQGQVIKGFDRGMLGMKVGGRRKVTIPHQLGYGVDGSPPRIPPRATLVFDLELLDVM